MPATPAALTTAEARARLRRDGANEVPEKRSHPLLRLAKKFWGLSAWMIELIALLSFILHKRADRPSRSRCSSSTRCSASCALTGESAELDKAAHGVVRSGSIVRQGEATGTVTATGPRTYFGRSTHLVEISPTPSSRPISRATPSASPVMSSG